ncbi:MAG: DUF4931 domain-containing protein [Nanoarchaeota archaeon]|nr:DUF4931 domain-containing protein [Nanoarchaeota archaeon]
MELRKDYFLDRWIILSEKRKDRPRQFKREHKKEDNHSACVFCPGNESLTPTEIGRVPSSSNVSASAVPNTAWQMRWFANKFAFVSSEENPKVVSDGKFFTYGGAYGFHEVVVETPSHDLQLWDLQKADVEKLLEIYKGRVEELIKKPSINYVVIFKNHGPEGGTSLVHSHTQVVAFSHIPPLVREKIDAAAKHTGCPYCKIYEVENKSPRKCFENSHALAFAPFASRFNYELWIMPQRHVKTFNDLTKDEISALAELIHGALSKLKALDASYNMLFFYSPDSDDLHFHIEITPRLATWAGFEFLTDVIVNSVSPETAAKFYRNEL